MELKQIRKTFVEYFASQGHEIVSSSSLVPADDPTLLFTNAGMVPFKDVFLGQSKRAYVRATSSQKCLRAGGKHNDLENVGMTARHHTFFEMLGNFSFGDYFKSKAIAMAWDLVTNHFKLPEESLLVTIYKDDDEAYRIWRDEIGIADHKIIRCGEKDNFWSMGDTGPCGPCSEIFYDHGEHVEGGPPGSADEDKDRFVEIWNLVFMQYDRQADGSLIPLPKPCVDTGMGLERMAAVLQGVHNNFDIDLFKALISHLESCIDGKINHTAKKVIVDHLRAMVFLISDQVYPSNEGRGYVLRRIMRRAIRYGYQGGVSEPFLHRAAVGVVEQMKDAYPILAQQQEVICQVIEREERLFFKTISQGLGLLEKMISGGCKKIDGELAFKLYDTYGFPIDILKDIAGEQSLEVDESGFNDHLQQQRERSKMKSQFKSAAQSFSIPVSSHFEGYDCDQSQAEITWLGQQDGNSSLALHQGDKGIIVAEKTPFYPEGGGQVGDVGLIETDAGLFEVETTIRQDDAILHIGQMLQGQICLGDLATFKVDKDRCKIKCNHSATHLLHSALREILGEHVVQRGSLVDANRLRFDFSHFEAMSAVQMQQIEARVNEMIQANVPATSEYMSLERAKASGVMALFDEKYDHDVRVMRFGDFSSELCGGTHVQATGDIGYFCFVSQSSAASGVRRVEALTGAAAIDYVQKLQVTLKEACDVLKCTPSELVARIGDLKRKKKESKQVFDVDTLLAGARQVGGVDVVFASIDQGDTKQLRLLADQLREKSQSVVALLRSTDDISAYVLCMSSSITGRLNGREIIKRLDAVDGISCRGGGKDNLFQGKIEAGSELSKSSYFEIIKDELETCQ